MTNPPLKSKIAALSIVVALAASSRADAGPPCPFRAKSMCENQLTITQAREGCGTLKTARSGQSTKPTKFGVLNDGDGPIEVAWLDFDGKPKVYATLAPGKSFDVDSFSTHGWEITEAGNCLAAVKLGPKPSSVLYLGFSGGQAPPPVESPR